MKMNMNFQRLLISQVFCILACTPVVWSQSFYTYWGGSANACGKTDKYSKPQPGAKEICKSAFALAGSAASLSTGSNGGMTLVNKASGASAFGAVDTVTLTPPSGYDKEEVTFLLVDTWATVIEGKGSAKGSVEWCWMNLDDCFTVSHTEDDGKVKKVITVQKSDSGFQFQVFKGAFAIGNSTKTKAGLTVDYGTPGEPSFEDLDGWTCTFASGNPCVIH